MKAKEMAKM